MSEYHSRTWFVTVSNPYKFGVTPDFIKENFSFISSINYYCFAYEMSDSGTPHVHIYLQSEKPLIPLIFKIIFPCDFHLNPATAPYNVLRDYILKQGRFEHSCSCLKFPGTFHEWGNPR